MGVLIFLLFTMVVLIMFTTSSAQEDEEDAQMNLIGNHTRKEEEDEAADLVIEKPEKEYKIEVRYYCFCGAEATDKNPPDVYINFIYELDEKGTRWFNNKNKYDNDKHGGHFSFKVKFPLYKKKNGKDRQQIAIQFYDYDPVGANDYLGHVGKFYLSEIVNEEVSAIPKGGELKKCNIVPGTGTFCGYKGAPNVVVRFV